MSVVVSPGKNARPGWTGGIAQGFALALLLALAVVVLLLAASQSPPAASLGPSATVGEKPAPPLHLPWAAADPGLLILLVDPSTAGSQAAPYRVMFESGGPLEVNLVPIADDVARDQFLADLADAEQLCATTSEVIGCRTTWVIDTRK